MSMTTLNRSPDRSDDARLRARFERSQLETLQARGPLLERRLAGEAPERAIVDCGWGRLLFAQTYGALADLADDLCDELPGARDIAVYISDPHVVLAADPGRLFLDPSHTFRLWLSQYRPARKRPRGFRVRRLQARSDAQAINDLYSKRGMVQAAPDFFWAKRKARDITYLLAEDVESGQIIGSVTGVDHVAAFDDPDNGASLWCLAVHPQAQHAGIGESLVRHLAEHYAARGRAFIDLSVLHDNEQAIALYDKLGFQRIPVFAVKKKNEINEKLFVGPAVREDVNPYALILIEEARRRGILVEVVDAEGGFFKLTHGGRTIHCRESLSQLTDAVAMSRCDDKATTRRVLISEGLNTPDQHITGDADDNAAFLAAHGAVVVKPARGEQGRGIAVDVRTTDELEAAIETARSHCDIVLMESYHAGADLRVIVIDNRVVAGAIRRPPEIIGDGVLTVKALIEKQSRRRQAATGGESKIPIDRETERCVRLAGYELSDCPPAGETIQVRKTANLHTGGTIHDVTDRLHHAIVDAATRAARALDIPVVGLDFLAPAVDEADYVIIEANERPGLANHEPQPTAERFIDLLFPQTSAL